MPKAAFASAPIKRSNSAFPSPPSRRPRATAKARAREWLEHTFDEFGCVPIRPTGKVLLLDKIPGIADAALEKHFQRDAEWGKSYAQAVSSALNRTGLQVDVEGGTASS